MLQMNVNSLFKNCSGMVPDVEDFFGFRFKTSFLTSSRDTDLKWKLSGTISGQASFICLILILILISLS